MFERRLQQSHGLLILTIPLAMVKRAKLHRGQSLRFTIRDGGEIVITPAGASEYERAVTEMNAKDSLEKIGGRAGTSQALTEIQASI